LQTCSLNTLVMQLAYECIAIHNCKLHVTVHF